MYSALCDTDLVSETDQDHRWVDSQVNIVETSACSWLSCFKLELVYCG